MVLLGQRSQAMQGYRDYERPRRDVDVWRFVRGTKQRLEAFGGRDNVGESVIAAA